MSDPPLGDAPLECDVCGAPILQGAGLFCDECQAPLCCQDCQREHVCASEEEL
jgi:hypothetical protein